jgi:hypothetical protein
LLAGATLAWQRVETQAAHLAAKVGLSACTPVALPEGLAVLYSYRVLFSQSGRV